MTLRTYPWPHTQISALIRCVLEESLQKPPEEGLPGLPTCRAGELATWCSDFCWSFGNMAYCVLADLFGVLDRSDPVDTSNVMSLALQREASGDSGFDNEIALAVTESLRERCCAYTVRNMDNTFC